MDSLPPMEVTIRAYAVVDKTAKLNTSKQTAYVYLPKAWANKRIRICAMDALDEDKKE